MSFHPAAIQRSISARSSGRKPAALEVALGAGEIDFGVRGVPVSDDEHAVAATQALHAVEDGAVEVELVGDAAVVPVLAAALREVPVDHHDLAEARELVAALDVEARISEGVLDPVGRGARVQPHAAVARAFGRDEVRMPPRRSAHLVGKLSLERPHFLDAHDVRVRALEHVEKSLLRAGPQTIDVPAHDSHGCSVVFRDFPWPRSHIRTEPRATHRAEGFHNDRADSTVARRRRPIGARLTARWSGGGQRGPRRKLRYSRVIHASAEWTQDREHGVDPEP